VAIYLSSNLSLRNPAPWLHNRILAWRSGEAAPLFCPFRETL